MGLFSFMTKMLWKFFCFCIVLLKELRFIFLLIRRYKDNLELSESDDCSSACGMNAACYTKASKLAVLDCFILMVY